MRMLLASLLLMAATARADDKNDAAMRFWKSGVALFEEGRFEDAAKEFQLAYREKPSSEFVYNEANSWDKAGRRSEAIAAYRRYLTLKGSDDDMAKVKARLVVLEREAAPVATARHAALPYVEPITKRTFPTYTVHLGKEYVLVGAGARKVLGFQVYAMGLYVEDEPARKAFPKLVGQAGGADAATLMKGDFATQFVAGGDFGKHARLVFLRAVTAKKQMDAYRDALGDDANASAPAELKRDADAFLALFDKDLKVGDEMTIHTDPDGKVWVAMGSGPLRAGPTNLRLEHDIWDIWLGRKPISDDLKHHLVERLDALGH